MARKPKIESYVWTCCNDKESCEACKALDGREWKPHQVISIRPPLPSCKSTKGCRCQIVAIYEGEGVVTLS